MRVPRPNVIRLRDVVEKPLEWLWPGVIPRGKLTLFEGDPGLGKSTISLDLAARLSRGAPWPDGSVQEDKGATIILSMEDSLQDTIKPRVLAQGGDPDQIFCFQGFHRDDGSWVPPVVPDCVPALAELALQVKPRILIIDPLMAFLSLGNSSVNDQAVRAALNPLMQLAEEERITVLVIRHLNKSGGAKALYRGSGSIGIVGAARAAFLVGQHPEDEEIRIMAPVKFNLGPPPIAWAFRVRAGENALGKLEWIDPSAFTADDLCGPPPKAGAGRAEALKFLNEMLLGGPRRADEMLRLAKVRHISERTLRRCIKEMGVIARRQTLTNGHVGWVWEKPAGRDATLEFLDQVAPSARPETSPIVKTESGPYGASNGRF